MKVIVSHDVDHIDSSDHIFKDLILEKIVARSLIQFFLHRISLRTCLYRCMTILRKRMNRIDEVMDYDRMHNIPSTFFFGMANGLGMSYSQIKAEGYILKVIQNGFGVGVHGVEYKDEKKVKLEYDDFGKVCPKRKFGIRTHYVRFDDHTFEIFEKTGYIFDSSYYNKLGPELINPYRIGNMWEFPLHIMDVYACKQGFLEDGIKTTHDIIDEAEKSGIRYLTILYHDHQFDELYDPQMKEWYQNTIEYCENKGFSFVSYEDAIKELEACEKYYTICQ